MWGVGQVEAAYDRAVAAGRDRSTAFDHFWRARQRFLDVLAGRLAAAIAYHAFFAAFAMALLAYAVLGYLLDYHLDLVNEVNSFLKQNLPWLNSDEIKGSRRTVGVVGLVGLVSTGIGWVETLRSSQRLIWNVQQQPGNPVFRRLIDLAILIGLFVLIGASLLAVDAIEAALEWLEGAKDTLGLTLSSWLLTGMLNMVLAAALLVAVPRLRIPVRRLFPSLLLVGLAITLLNSVGRFFIARSASGPVYQVVAGTVGLLVYLYLFNQVLLFGAALAATGSYGRVIDLATGQPPADLDPAPTPYQQPPLKPDLTPDATVTPAPDPDQGPDRGPDPAPSRKTDPAAPPAQAP